MVILRDIDALECYVTHRDIVKDMMGSSQEYIKRFCFDPLEPWVTLVRNRFPYKGQEGRHWLLWVHPLYERFWTPSRVRRILGRAYHSWENPEPMKSIPGILHYHIVPGPLSQPRGAGCHPPPRLYDLYS